MAEYIFELNEALYNEETGEVCFKPTVKGELVRCKDCIHLEILNGGYCYARCKWHNRLFYGFSFGQVAVRNWYCADGERRRVNDEHTD